MKKKLTLLLSGILLLSCTSLKDPKYDNIALLLIPHKVNNEKIINTFGNYVYVIKNLSTNKEVRYKIPVSNGTGKMYLKPGKYELVSLLYEYSNHQTTDSKTSIGYNFTVTKGYITVLPIVFTSNLTVNDGRETIYPSVDNITNEEYHSAIDSISHLDRYDLWTIE